MTQNGYRYMLDLYKDDGSPVGQVPLEVDWEPALEWAHFVGIRRGRLPPVTAVGPSAIEPVWHDRLGRPYLAGFRAVILDNGRQVSTQIPTSYFRALARQASTHFVDRGALKAGEVFHYLVSAFPQDRQHADETGDPGGFTVEEVAQPLTLDRKSLDHLWSQSTPIGEADAEDMPVFVPQHVLAEVAALAQQAGPKETGGVLIGYLHRDTASPEIIVEATAQIRAEHSHSELTRLTFTAATWTAVRAAIELRDDGTIMLGWWHSHCFMKETCKDCEKSKDGTCDANVAFMSTDDCVFHRTIFPRAWSIALVVGDSPCAGLTFALFGWRCGTVASRGFRVLGSAVPGAQPPHTMDQGDEHAK